MFNTTDIDFLNSSIPTVLSLKGVSLLLTDISTVLFGESVLLPSGA